MKHKRLKKEFIEDEEQKKAINKIKIQQSTLKKIPISNKKGNQTGLVKFREGTKRNCGRLSRIPELYGEENSSATEKQRAVKMKQYVSSLIDQPDKVKYDSLTPLQEWAYSVGHLMNDLTAACWFNYLLYWLKQVLQFKYASWSMLSGQIFDATTTPLVGYLSDKTNTRFGKRMPWYVVGTILVLIGFFPVFHCFIPGLIWKSLDSEGFKAFYYIFFPSLFNVGWAAVQISHMSLVPSLTVSRKRRDTLNNKRNTFTFIANILVLFCALILFQTVKDSMIDFELLSCIVLGIGLFSTVFFIICINEKKLMKDCDRHTKHIKRILLSATIPIYDRSTQIIDRQQAQLISQNDNIVQTYGPNYNKPCHNDHQDNSNNNDDDENDDIDDEEQVEQLKSWKDWLKEKEFYHYALVYMGCRIYCNIISTMINFYLVYVLRIASDDEATDRTPIEIALIPLLLFISSVLMSSALDQLYQRIGKRKIFSIGAGFMTITSLCLAFVEAESGYLMYPIAILIGCTQVLLLNTGITLISDVIGLKGKSGAFVFGSYSFMDKISTGITIFFISESSYFKSEFFIRWVTVLVPFCSGLLAWVLVMTGSIPDIISSFNSESEGYDSEESYDIINPYKNRRLNSNSFPEYEDEEDDIENDKEQEGKNKQFIDLIQNIKREFAN